jgi:hypothetical protein
LPSSANCFLIGLRALETSEVKSLASLILCFAPLALANAGQPDAPLPGQVTLVYFWAKWWSMQSGYASLGEDGGNRCRYCAAQD